MLNKLKEYLVDVTQGYRNTLMNEELEWVLSSAIKEIEGLESELLNLKRDSGWTNQ